MQQDTAPRRPLGRTGRRRASPAKAPQGSAMTPEEFRAWRIGLGLSQHEAAAALGRSHSAVQKWEGGVEPIDRAVMLATRCLADPARDFADAVVKEWGIVRVVFDLAHGKGTLYEEAFARLDAAREAFERSRRL
jgi:transcriptional regulator with XRE-family HTH domain